jgi:rubredoxin
MEFTKLIPKKSSFYEHIESLQTSEEIKKPLQATDYFRASSIYKMCPREEALYHKYSIDRKERIPPSLWRTFRFGRIFEKFFRDELLGDSGTLIGNWKCNVCSFQVDKCSKPKLCDVCGANAFEYVERDLVDHSIGVGGHPDGEIFWENEYYLLELKTTNSFKFASILNEPMENHIAQMQIYMHILQYNKGLIFYFNKDSSQIIMHEVAYNQSFVTPLLEKPKKYKYYLKTGILPDRICFQSENPRASKCKVCKLCFAD